MGSDLLLRVMKKLILFVLLFSLTSSLSALNVDELNANLELLRNEVGDITRNSAATEYFESEFSAFIQAMSQDEIVAFFFKNAELSKWDGFKIESRSWECGKPRLRIGLLVDNPTHGYTGYWQHITVTFEANGKVKVRCRKSMGGNMKVPPPPPEAGEN